MFWESCGSTSWERRWVTVQWQNESQSLHHKRWHQDVGNERVPQWQRHWLHRWCYHRSWARVRQLGLSTLSDQPWYTKTPCQRSEIPTNSALRVAATPAVDSKQLPLSTYMSPVVQAQKTASSSTSNWFLFSKMKTLIASRLCHYCTYITDANQSSQFVQPPNLATIHIDEYLAFGLFIFLHFAEWLSHHWKYYQKFIFFPTLAKIGKGRPKMRQSTHATYINNNFADNRWWSIRLEIQWRNSR